MQKWMTWLEDLAKRGKIKDRGQPLEPAGKVVNGKQKAITDGPYAEAKELMRGGSVEVRPVMKFLPSSRSSSGTAASRAAWSRS
jgi:hypothetical protein